MNKPVLIYFPVRGRAELIRIVLAAAAVDYDEHPVGAGTPPHAGRPTDFKELKASGLLPFDAVPVWEEPDGFRLAQSQAIARHLARGYDLLGSGARDAALVDQMLGACDDVRAEIRKLVPAEPAKRPAIRDELVTSFLPRWLGYLDRQLAANAGGDGFVVGDRPSLADLALFHLLELIRDNHLDAGLARRPRLLGFMERVAGLPRVRAYLESPRRFPFAPLPT